MMHILINGTFFQAPSPIMTGIEIKKFSGIHETDHLYRYEPGKGYEITDMDEVMLIDRDVFASAPQGYILPKALETDRIT